MDEEGFLCMSIFNLLIIITLPYDLIYQVSSKLSLPVKNSSSLFFFFNPPASESPQTNYYFFMAIQTALHTSNSFDVAHSIDKFLEFTRLFNRCCFERGFGPLYPIYIPTPDY